MLRSALAATCFLTVASVGPAAAQAMTSKQLRALGPEEADAQARRDLDAILLPPGRYPTGNRIEVGAIWFETRPFAATIRGVCAKDYLILQYAPVEEGNYSENRGQRPYGVEAQRTFAFLRQPSPTMLDEDSDRLEGMPDVTCRALTGGSVRWIAAEDPEAIVVAWLAFDAAVEALSRGAVKLKGCDGSNGHATDARRCAAELMERHDYRRLAGLSRCDAPPGNVCHRLDIDGRWIEIELRQSIDSAKPSSEDIVSLSLVEYITVT